MPGGKIIVSFWIMTGDATMHKPTEGLVSWGLGLHFMNDLPNTDASLISLPDSMVSHTSHPFLELISTYQATL